MNPATHFLGSWFIADSARLSRRDRIIGTVCGVLPDLDGLGAVPDLVSRLAGRETHLYGNYHHALLHGLPAALASAIVSAMAGTSRFRVAVAAFVAVHAHLLADLVGSRGPAKEDVWPISYLAPLSDAATISVGWQWQLNAWPNILVTVVLLALVARAAVVKGYTPIEVFSRGAERAFAEDVQRRWEQVRRGGGR